MNFLNLRRPWDALLRRSAVGVVLVLAYPGAAQVGSRPAAKQIRTTVPHVAGRYELSKLGERGVGRGLNFYSAEQEHRAGRELAKRFESEQQVVHDPVVNSCLERIADKLVAGSDARPVVTVRIVERDDLNALTFPGGFIYVTTGMVRMADNEAQMAAILAHEIAHVEARHATRDASREKLIDAAFSAANFLPGPIGYPLHKLRAWVLFRMAAAAEREADVLGLEYQYEAGYDVREFSRLLEKAGLQDPQSCTGFAFATCRDRINRLKQTERRFLAPRGVSVNDTAEFKAVRARLMMMTTATSLPTRSALLPTARPLPEGDSSGDTR